MSINRLISILLLATMLLIAVSVVRADDGEDEADAFEREFEVTKNGNDEFELKSKRKSKNAEEEIYFHFDSKSSCGVRLRARYESEINNVETEFRTEVRLYRLIRYAEAVPYIDQTALETITLDDASTNWNNITCTNTNGNYRCTLSSNDGRVNITADFVTGPTTIDGVTASPLSMKWGLSFRKNGAGSVALVTRVVTKTEQESEQDSTIEDESDDNKAGITSIREKQVKFGGNGYVSWVSDYTIDGTAAGNVATGSLVRGVSGCSDSDESAKQLTFSFTNAADGVLVWDPKVGFSYTGSAMAVVPSMMLALVALIALVL